jgi:hypothetical protein
MNAIVLKTLPNSFLIKLLFIILYLMINYLMLLVLFLILINLAASIKFNLRFDEFDAENI